MKDIWRSLYNMKVIRRSLYNMTEVIWRILTSSMLSSDVIVCCRGNTETVANSDDIWLYDTTSRHSSTPSSWHTKQIRGEINRSDTTTYMVRRNTLHDIWTKTTELRERLKLLVFLLESSSHVLRHPNALSILDSWEGLSPLAGAVARSALSWLRLWH